MASSNVAALGFVRLQILFECIISVLVSHCWRVTRANKPTPNWRTHRLPLTDPRLGWSCPRSSCQSTGFQTASVCTVSPSADCSERYMATPITGGFGKGIATRVRRAPLFASVAHISKSVAAVPAILRHPPLHCLRGRASLPPSPSRVATALVDPPHTAALGQSWPTLADVGRSWSTFAQLWPAPKCPNSGQLLTISGHSLATLANAGSFVPNFGSWSDNSTTFGPSPSSTRDNQIARIGASIVGFG